MQDQIAQLQKEGYCLVRDVIPACKVQEVRRDIDDAEEAGKRAYEDLNWSHVNHMLSLAPYLADPRLLDIVRSMFNHSNVRISQTEFKSVQPRSNGHSWRGYHTDWPHDLTDLSRCGRVNQPFPDMIMSLTTIWMLSTFTPESGASWVVPGTHRDLRNPRGEDDGIDQFSSIPNEIQVCGDAGDVLMIDSRIWHSRGANTTDEIRTSIVARYSPWWLSVDQGNRNRAFLPVHIFDALPEAVQALYAHRRGKTGVMPS